MLPGWHQGFSPEKHVHLKRRPLARKHGLFVPHYRVNSQHPPRPTVSGLYPVVEMQPLEYRTRTERNIRKEELIAIWDKDRAPDHLAFFKV